MNLASHLDLDLSKISDRHNQYLETWSPFQGGNMLGDETCDISHSRVRSKTFQGGSMLGDETCDISHSRVEQLQK